jgi:hypothetical protein
MSGPSLKKLGKEIRLAGVIWGREPAWRDGELLGILRHRVHDPDRDIEAIHMPKVAVRRLRSFFCRFPHASPALPNGAGKQNATKKGHSKQFIFLRKSGAGEGIRTLDPNLGKVVLYP